MLLLVIFGLMALALAAIGVYGVLAYSVRRRQREFGIRAALGANARDLRRLVLLRAFRLIVIGLTIGLAASLALGRIIGSFLFQVKAQDPVTFVVVPLLVGIVALLAVSIPALRASRTGVMSLLRSE
jgi:ABC-type antimicrobial peptide transport system permease subunit